MVLSVRLKDLSGAAGLRWLERLDAAVGFHDRETRASRKHFSRWRIRPDGIALPGLIHAGRNWNVPLVAGAEVAYNEATLEVPVHVCNCSGLR